MALASITSCVVEPAKWVGGVIWSQFNYLWFFSSNIKSLEDETKKLDDAAEGLQAQVAEARNNVQVIVAEVETWLTKSNNMKDEINGILDEAKNVGSGCSKSGARFSLSKRAEETTNRIKELLAQKKFDPICHSGPSAATQANSLGNIYEFQSRKKIEEEMMTILRGGDVKMIGICGMGGLGKTTMANKIMNRVLEEDVFQEAVIAVVSQQVDKSKIQDEIAGQLDLNLKEITSAVARYKKLRARLSGGAKRILVVHID